MTATWSTNKNKIESLSEFADERQILGSYVSGNVSIIGTKGGTTGDIWGYKLKRNAKGEVIITSAGLPARPSEIEYVACALPDWEGRSIPLCASRTGHSPCNGMERLEV